MGHRAEGVGSGMHTESLSDYDVRFGRLLRCSTLRMMVEEE